MNPAAVLLLPLSTMVLAATTVSAAPPHRAQSMERAAQLRLTPAGLRAPSAIRADAAAGSPSVRLPQVEGLGTGPHRERLAAGPGRSSPALRGRWGWPLQPQPAVERAFVRPVTKYGAGHRGVDLGGSAGQVVHAVEAGTVTHVGRIAGRGTVTVLHASGIRSTYEPLDATVTTGAVVSSGDLLGRLEGSGSHCGVATCLHLGALRGEAYLDPLVFIVGGRRVRLLPLGQVPEG